MTKTGDLLKNIRRFLAYVATNIDFDSSNGYFDSSKFAEILFKPVFGKILNKEFQQFKKINHPAIDLYSLDDEIAIQVSSECSAKKVRQTLDDFLKHGFHETYKKLYILFLKDYSPKAATLDNLLNNTRYRLLTERPIFDTNSLINPNSLYKFIEDCSPAVIEEIHAYLANEFSSAKTINDFLPIEIPTYTPVKNYIDRHLTTTDHHDYWAFRFEKRTLYNIIEDNIKNNKSIRIIIKAGAGQGKSIELDNVGYQIQTHDLDLYPLRLTIKNYTANLHQFFNQKYPFWERVTKSKVVLLVDGLDEIHPTVYSTFLSEFNHLLDSEPELKAICTIRSNFDSEVYTANNENFETYYIDRLFQSDIDLYIEAHSKRPDDLKTLAKKHWTKHIIHIPFYLTELVKLSNNDLQELPHNLDDLYAKIIAQRLSQDMIKYKGGLNKQEVYNAMQKVAIFMTLQGENIINLTKMSEISQLDRHQILANSFLSTYDEDIETRVSFIHNNFQEYLAAKRLSKLQWPEIKKILFNAEGEFLNVKLLNTTILLFSILPQDDVKHKSLTSAVNESDYTLLFHFEKERIPLADRLNLFTRFILESKQKKIAYLSGDFTANKLVDFIDGDTDGLEFVIREINSCTGSSNHFRSLLFFLYEYSTRPLSKKRKNEIFEIVKSLIKLKGFTESEYWEMIDIIESLGFFTEDILNNTIKKCPLIHYNYVLTRVIDLIHKNGIPHQFEFVLQNAKNLILNKGTSASNYKQVFAKYILENTNSENHTVLLNRLAGKQSSYVNHLLTENDYFEENKKIYLDRLYIKLAQLNNQTSDNKIAFNFINYLNEVKYDSYSNTTYGHAIEFFRNIVLENLFEWFLKSQPLLQSGHIFNQLFDLQNVDHSQVIISLHTYEEINDERLKALYWITFSYSSKTSLGLCHYLCTQFPDDFRPFKTLATIENNHALWKKMDARLLNDRNLFVETVGKIIMHIKSDAPQLISEHGTIDFHHEYRRELKEKFGCNIAIDFLDWDCRGKPINEIPDMLMEDKAWFIYVAKAIVMYKHDESLSTLLTPAKSFLQTFADGIISSINYKALHDVEFDRDEIEIQTGLLVKEEIIELPFEKAIELLYFEQIEHYISGHERMDDFLITKYSLEAVKPHIIEIIENDSCAQSIKASAIAICKKHGVTEPSEDIFELFENKDFHYKEVCFSYLKSVKFNKNRLLQHLVRNPKIYDNWQLDLVNYLLDDSITHNELTKILDEQVEFKPNIDSYDHLPAAISTYGLRLGSQKCMRVFFEYIQAKKYYSSTIRYLYFEAVEKLYPDELFKLGLESLEIYRRNIVDHAGDSICGALDSIITNLASQDSTRFREVITLYDRVIQEHSQDIPNIHALEWWKIRLTNRFQERNSKYLTEEEAMELI